MSKQGTVSKKPQKNPGMFKGALPPDFRFLEKVRALTADEMRTLSPLSERWSSFSKRFNFTDDPGQFQMLPPEAVNELDELHKDLDQWCQAQSPPFIVKLCEMVNQGTTDEFFRIFPGLAKTPEDFRRHQLETYLASTEKMRAETGMTASRATELAYWTNAITRELWPGTMEPFDKVVSPKGFGDRTFLSIDLAPMLETLRERILQELDSKSNPPRPRANTEPSVRTDSGPNGWSKADSPKRWATCFGFSLRTLQRRIKDGVVRCKKLSSKSYQIAVDDIPEPHRTKFLPPRS